MPIRSSGWFGTGTVIVVPSSFFCITMWLPCCRTSTNPFRLRIAHTSFPESARNLPNGNGNPGYVHFFVETLLDLVRRSGIKEKLKSFSKVIARLFDSATLARNVQLRAERNIAISLTLDDSCKLLFHNIYSSLRIWCFLEELLPDPMGSGKVIEGPEGQGSKRLADAVRQHGR